jgi:hypothetical protein
MDTVQVAAAFAQLDGLALHWRKPIGSSLCGPAKAQCAAELEAALVTLRAALSKSYDELKYEIWVTLNQAHPRECCADPECVVCGMIACPDHEPMHFHHDGCPACAFREGGATA